MVKAVNPRVTLALEAAPLPEGEIVVFGAVAGAADLSALPVERVTMVTPMRGDCDHFSALGYRTMPALETPGPFAAALIFIPRARDAARAVLAEAVAALPSGAPIWVDGAKTDGIDALYRELRKLAAPGEALAKAHGKIFCLPAAPLPDLWAARDLTPAPGFVTRPGVFSADAPDRGSQLLAEALPARLPGRVADLGAGWGWLSAQILAREGVQHLDLIEADHRALSCARRNLSDPRAAFHWADALRHRPDPPYGAVVMNPPFHQGRAGEPGLGVAFIRAAAGMLSGAGVLYLVANRHLPYEQALGDVFREVTELGGDGGFKLIRAARPATQGRVAQARGPVRKHRR